MRHFPQCHFYNLDKLDYCGTTKNLEGVADAPNYTFVRVRDAPWRRRDRHGTHASLPCAGGTGPCHRSQGSVTSPDLVMFLLRDKAIDTVMHFAAQSHVGTPPWPRAVGRGRER